MVQGAWTLVVATLHGSATKASSRIFNMALLS